MKVILCEDDKDLGKKVSDKVYKLYSDVIKEKETVRMLFSTGMSQFTTFESLIKSDIDWSRVEMFHLDEYIGIDANHPASFIKYLRERFIEKINIKKVHFVDPSKGVESIMNYLQSELDKAPIDIGLIGIGENTHIAFNDPPADFDITSAYKIVDLDEACRRQQLGEGWFKTLNDVPKQAISMTVRQILKCKKIVSAVPYKVKAKAVHDVLTAPEVTNKIPATAFRLHDDVTLFVDIESASMTDIAKYI